MPRLFNVDIAGIIAKTLGLLVLDATLHKKTSGTRTPGSISGGTNPTSADFPGKGFVESYREDQIDGTSVKENHRKVVLIAGTFTGSPEVFDTVTIEDRIWSILHVARDPAGATYECQAE